MVRSLQPRLLDHSITWGGATHSVKAACCLCQFNSTFAGIYMHCMEPSYLQRSVTFGASAAKGCSLGMWEPLVSYHYKMVKVICWLHVAWLALSAYRNYLSLSLLYDIINNHQSLSLPGSIQFNKPPSYQKLFTFFSSSSINFSFFVDFIFCIPYSILLLSCVPVFRHALYH